MRIACLRAALCAVAALFSAELSAAPADQAAQLHGRWCLVSLSATLDGARVPDGATYEFTEAGQLNYRMGPFEQSAPYRLEGDRVSTDGMGSYKIVSITPDAMTLYYASYFFFERGSCR